MSEYLTADELAEQMKTSSRAVLQWAKDGKIPCIRLGPKTIRFNPDDVQLALSQTNNKAKCNTDASK